MIHRGYFTLQALFREVAKCAQGCHQFVPSSEAQPVTNTPRMLTADQVDPSMPDERVSLPPRHIHQR